MPFGGGRSEASPLGGHQSNVPILTSSTPRCHSSMSGRYSSSNSSVHHGIWAHPNETVKPKRAWFDEFLSGNTDSENEAAAKRKMRSRSANARAAMSVRGGRFSSATSSDENDEPTHLTMDEIRALINNTKLCTSDSSRLESTSASHASESTCKRGRLDRKSSFKTVTAHTSFVIMRKPQPVKIFDSATTAPASASATSTAGSNGTQLRSTTPLSFLFRDRPPRPSTAAPSCATPFANRRYVFSKLSDAKNVDIEPIFKRTRPESAPPSECYKIVPQTSLPATEAILETVRIADDPSSQSKANTLPTRLNYVLLVNDDAAQRSKPCTGTGTGTDAGGSQTASTSPSLPSPSPSQQQSPPKRTFTQKLRRLFSISKTSPVVSHGGEAEISDASRSAASDSTSCVGASIGQLSSSRSGVSVLATHSHATAFRPVQPRSRPAASNPNSTSGVLARAEADTGSLDLSRRADDDRSTSSNVQTASIADSPERGTTFTGQNRSGFLTNLTQLRQRGWYWGPLTSEQAELLLSEKEDGSFLVRDSSHDMYILSLSFRSNGITGHVRIEHQGGKFRFTSEPASYHAASSIIEFIEKAMEHSRSGRFQYFVQATAPGQPPLPVTLLRPVSRFETVARLQHLCRFEILKHTRCDHVDALPLPSKLKDYLKQKQFYVDLSTLPGEPLANASAIVNVNVNVNTNPNTNS